MFDAELISVIAIFAGIAALIVYINERSKRKLKISANPLKLKKMPGPSDSSQTESPQPSPNLEEWNFPKPIDPSPSTLAPPEVAFAKLPSAQSTPKAQSNWRTPHLVLRRPQGLATRAQLREAMINMTILGPCRANSPFQDRD